MTQPIAVVRISHDGTVSYIYSDALAAVGRGVGVPSTRRASHVEPDGDTWTADLTPSGGPVVTGFPTRAEALRHEIAWLTDRLKGG